jgi:hypothetical protein
VKYGPPTDAAERRVRLCQIDNQRSIESETARRILASTDPLQEWERDYLTQLAQGYESWQHVRKAIDNRLSRGTDIRELRRREGVA